MAWLPRHECIIGIRQSIADGKHKQSEALYPCERCMHPALALLRLFGTTSAGGMAVPIEGEIGSEVKIGSAKDAWEASRAQVQRWYFRFGEGLIAFGDSASQYGGTTGNYSCQSGKMI